jgi:hypothetical protein
LGGKPVNDGVPALLPPQKNHKQEASGNGGVMFWLRHPASKPMRDHVANEICLAVSRGANSQAG